eukprot:NODE_279_length_2536_cov_23.774427_g257_i0.p6 GENE.NODE_279_length_2536_cov_23.774427_g257_i0~~NODE_279_length_2536_cov_23.774427_g257_i0.p6  ORF type:complete len:121 (+),score=17.62 NODE_279_length_2536_cov_23.774427_g257_i0:773-1135(+)
MTYYNDAKVGDIVRLRLRPHAVAEDYTMEKICTLFFVDGEEGDALRTAFANRGRSHNVMGAGVHRSKERLPGSTHDLRPPSHQQRHPSLSVQAGQLDRRRTGPPGRAAAVCHESGLQGMV